MSVAIPGALNTRHSETPQAGSESVKKCAFTLAEVLITLGIIGVVAALTVPTLMQKTDERETVSKFKKNVKVFSDAVGMAVTEHGNIKTWGLTKDDADSAAKINEYISPYLKVQKICNQGNCDGYSISGFNKLSGGIYDIVLFNNFPRLFLADGSIAIIRPYETSFAIFIDLNGNKDPNTFGKDIFNFNYSENGVLGFSGFGENPSSTGWAYCNPSSGEGWYCAAWVFYKENLDYLHCAEDLSWNGKTKCD